MRVCAYSKGLDCSQNRSISSSIMISKHVMGREGRSTPPGRKSWQCISRRIEADAVRVELSAVSTFLPITHNTVASIQTMSDDEIVAGPPGATSIDARGASESKPRYRSWRKKYRKMKTHFDDVMKESNSLFVDEQKLDALSKRLQEQNE